MLNWNPKMNDACDEEMPIPAGVYEAVVGSVVNQVSRAGNPMFRLKLLVDLGEEGMRSVSVYLLPLQQCLWKLKQFCFSAGLEDCFHNGNLTSDDCQGIAVRVRIENDDPDWDGSYVSEFLSKQ